jgi:spermidine synthase
MNRFTAGNTRAIVLVLFFLSGACTLVYEVVWVRMLVLVFGTSVYAVSTVLSAFMAGLALGAALFGRLVDRRGNPMRIYAGLELGIGLFALVFPLILAGLDDLYTVLYRQLGGTPYLFSLVRFVLGFLVLLVPTTLMGATLPVLSKYAVRRLGRVGRNVGGLYAVNTFGAMAGCLVTALLLMEHAGVRGSTWIAAGTNLLIAGAAWWLSRQAPQASHGDKKAGKEKRTTPEPAPPPPHMVRLVFWGFALSGFTALGYEVIWTRLLGVVMRLTVSQSLSAILVAFLFGLAAGGAVGARYADRWRGLFAVFGSIELALGLFGLASVAVFGAIPRVMEAIPAATFWGHLGKVFAVSFLVMLVPTFLMGLLFPVAGRIHVLGLGSLGRRVGNVYAANTAGAIAGAFAAGFILIPLLGTQRSIELLAWINVAVGAAIVGLDPDTEPRRKTTRLAALGVPVLLLTLVLPSSLMENVFRRTHPGSELLYYDEAAGGTVTVFEHGNGERILRVNGAGEVPTDRASIQIFRLLGNLPMLIHPDPRDVLVIAFGGGVTLSSVERHAPRRLDCVEIVPGVFDAAHFFERYNFGLHKRLDQPPLELIVDDGRNHVLRTERRYDVIISDSTHPGTADSWVLYTEEFYRLCRARLKQGGMFAQWLPLHGLTEDGYAMILRTFQRAFPDASLWLTEEYSVLLGATDDSRIDLGRLEQRLAGPAAREALAPVNLDDAISFLATLALEPNAFADYVGDGLVNTDDRPWISVARRMRSGGGGSVPVLMGLVPRLAPRVDGFLVNAGAEELERIARRRRSRLVVYRGYVFLEMGKAGQAVTELRRARSIDPADREAERLLQRAEQVLRRAGDGG